MIDPDNEAHVMAVAEAMFDVMAVTEYHVDRERVWPADADEDAA